MEGVNIDKVADIAPELEKLFKKIANDWSELLFPEDYRDLIRGAYNELALPQNAAANQNAFHELGDAIKNVEDQDSQSTQKIEWRKAGLEGKQWELKRKALVDAWNVFKAFGTVKWLKYLLDLLNKILHSILSVLNVGEGIKEFKDMIEGLLKDDQTEHDARIARTVIAQTIITP
jgi:hypothetical protein